MFETMRCRIVILKLEIKFEQLQSKQTMQWIVIKSLDFILFYCILAEHLSNQLATHVFFSVTLRILITSQYVRLHGSQWRFISNSMQFK